MKWNPTYRAAALLLVGVCGIFNVGLPIVVASCPMAKMQNSPVCIMCTDDAQSGGPRLSTHVDRSCCETKFAAERNTTEFLQTQHKLERAKFVVEIPLLSCVAPPTNLSYAGSLRAYDTSPPYARDLLIIISSLLI